jgi:hypothetical protein
MADTDNQIPILQFKNLTHFCQYWDGVTNDCLNDTTATGRPYADAIRSRRQNNDDRLSAPIRLTGDPPYDSRIDWFGYPVPTSVQEAMDRRAYKNMTLYNEKYEELSPFFGRLEKVSTGILPKAVIQPNDKEIGTFSLERAMMSVDKILRLWSDKHKEFFFINEGVGVMNADGTEKKIKVKVEKFEGGGLEEVEAPVFKLIKDGSEAYLTQYEEGYTYNPKTKVREGGNLDWGSNNKNSFLWLQKMPRPHRNVRLFVLIGGNGTLTEPFWAGISAVMVCNFLQSKGYAVRVTACIEAKHYGNTLNHNGVFRSGNRISIFDVKPYDEPINSLGLLYPLADPSFYRIRSFDYFMAEQWKFRDVLDTGLYGSADLDEFRNLIDEAVKINDIVEEKDTLYYYIGGNDSQSLEGAKRNMIEIICKAENHNKETLIKLGYDIPPPDNQQVKTYDDFDCADYI